MNEREVIQTESFDFEMFDLELDSLDKYWLEQPKLVASFGKRLANARNAYERAKVKQEVIQAEAEMEIASSPEDFGIEKATVSAINSAIIRHPKVKAAVRKTLKRKHNVDILQTVLNALEHRKRALEGLVDLHGQSYFAVPISSKEGQRVIEDKIKNRVRRGRKEGVL